MTTRTPRRPAAESIAATLRERIHSGRYQPGKKLPAEPRLAEELRTSRVTLREALRVLQQEGLIMRKHGSGTFVGSKPTVPHSLHINFSVESLIKATGHEPGTIEARWRQDRADETVASRLLIEVDDPVWFFERLRTSDGRPVIHSIDHLPAAVIGNRGPGPGTSLYEYLESIGLPVVRGVATLEPTVADPETAAMLDAEPGSLCLTIRQVDFDVSGTPIIYSIEHHLADAFEFNVLRQGPASPGGSAG